MGSSQMTEYLVSSDKYLAALERPWFTEQRFQLWMLEAGGESFWSEGFIVGIAKQERQFRGVLLPWEVLQVEWDDGSTENHAVNPWEVTLIDKEREKKDSKSKKKEKEKKRLRRGDSSSKKSKKSKKQKKREGQVKKEEE